MILKPHWVNIILLELSQELFIGIEPGVALELDFDLLIWAFLTASEETFSLIVVELDLSHSHTKVADTLGDHEQQVSHLLSFELSLVLRDKVGLLLLSHLFDLGIWESLDCIFVFLDLLRFLFEFSLVHKFLLNNSFVELFSGCLGV